MATDEYLKARVSDALWILGSATTQDVSSMVNESPDRVRGILRLLSDEGCATRSTLPGPFMWELVRPYDNGTLSARISLMLWDEARPVSAPEVIEVLGIKRGTVVSILKNGVAMGKFLQDSSSARPVYWAKGRCSENPRPPVVRLLRENGRMDSRQLAEALGDTTSRIYWACRSAESKGLVRECGRRLIWAGGVHVSAVVWEAVA